MKHLVAGIIQHYTNRLFLLTTLIGLLLIALLLPARARAQQPPRVVTDFTKNWRFALGDHPAAKDKAFADADWRTLNLPHDWSIEGQFSEHHLTTTQGGALPTGIGWYRKTGTLPATTVGKRVYVEFDGIYRHSEVWLNGHPLGTRASGYSSFRYDLTPYLTTGPQVLAVRVDNSAQPNTRWYSGSGIYRNVRLVLTSDIAIDQWGTFVRTPVVSDKKATVTLQLTLRKTTAKPERVSVRTRLFSPEGKLVSGQEQQNKVLNDSLTTLPEPVQLTVTNPQLWSVEQPDLYALVTEVYAGTRLVDRDTTRFGIRTFRFDAAAGFSLNGKPTKIHGVCLHHDLGALGAAVNVRAMERQLGLLKKMGCNAIRTSHNLPAPEFLDLCDRMGFLVMDEAFDMWKKKKSKRDYGLDWDQWHRIDLETMVKRDRNHPSVILWSIGNEIREQFDSTGITIARELAGIVKALDPTRPITSALTENVPEKNFIYQSGALDVLGFNYKHTAYPDFPKLFPNVPVLASETGSSLQTRGHYDMPSDSVRMWGKPKGYFTEGNPDWTASAYDNEAAYWGSTHEQTWKVVKKYPHIAGLFVWTGFDYLGEPHPYPWPARSSYFGILDLAGFPKDVYYLYQSEWTSEPVLHVFPHWNWPKGKPVDVWAYYNQADEVELFLNDKSVGVRRKTGDDLHVMWRVPFEAGSLKAISRKNGQVVQTREIRTAGKAAKIQLIADRTAIAADGKDLAYITVRVLDEAGNLVPDATHLINFDVAGSATIAGVDNGYQASLEPFKASYRRAYNGLCLAILQATETSGTVRLRAVSEGLQSAEVVIEARK